MIFDMCYKHAQPLNRIQVSQYLIVRSSTKSKCIICGTETHWRDSDDMQPVCEKACLRQLHRAEQVIDHLVGRLKSNELHA